MKEKIIEAFTSIYDSILENAPAIIIGVFLFLFFMTIGYLLKSIIKKRLRNRIDDQLLVNFIGRIIFSVFLVIAVILFLNQVGLGKAASGLLAGAGVSALIIGFAFKDIGENFLAGFFLAFSRPFSIGDVIEVSDLKGIVKSLSFRNAHIRTFDGKDIFIPNAMLIKNPLQNYTRDGLLRYDFVVGIDYSDKIDGAVKAIENALLSSDRIEHEGDLKPFIQLEAFETSTINLGVYYWVNSKNFEGHIAGLKTDVMTRVVEELMKNGFSLPADILELKTYKEDQPIKIESSTKS